MTGMNPPIGEALLLLVFKYHGDTGKNVVVLIPLILRILQDSVFCFCTVELKDSYVI